VDWDASIFGFKNRSDGLEILLLYAALIRLPFFILRLALILGTNVPYEGCSPLSLFEVGIDRSILIS